ncbi:ABC transporter substrate-binding protein [Thauera linaloolentis]|uniref:Putative sulfate ester transport system substrate-binding protein n=1 Tax=Thauera linaloolentis (strain DSM 12138 / JCM 21573 / CCUG 41526 / CIP 105981 / IAM 15112 / NBRC 102519 / 47Lol) TaxID=1123367 RepID=N6XZI3_THAL4|nr:ABC transporter substrate-binding protein [Thauera linaloolentis]ENO84675.1 putative sulfate ester transport system substrate-binding protein [Thauera linaloolentis 47Lol = DSM 12138]MCM8564249.1 ABC transporter substrate-binding protein [Thauera linaloolentis]
MERPLRIPPTPIRIRALFAAALAMLSLHAVAAELPARIVFGEVGGTNVTSTGGKPVSSGLVALAEHLGYFEEEFGKGGPAIEQVFFVGTGPAQNEALAQGSIDFGTYGGVPNVIGLAGGIPAHIVATRRATGSGTYYLAVRSDSPYRTVADLKGKRITVQKGTNPYRSLIQLLEAQGLQEKDITVVNLQGPEALVAFNAGAVDAVFGGVNLLIQRDQGKLRVLDGTRDFAADNSQSGVLVSGRFEKAHPDVVRRVVKILLRASHWASEENNREALLKFVAARSVGYEYVKEDYAGSLKVRFNPLIDESSYTAYGELVAFGVKHKLIRRGADDKAIRSWFKPEYQQAALKELQLESYWR